MTLHVDDVVKRLGGRRVLDGLTLACEEPGAVAVTGDNGAGKSTLLRVVAGVLEPERGDVRLDGHSIVGRHVAGRRRLGYLPEASDPPGHLSVAELVDLCAALKGSPGPAPELVDRLALRPLLGQRLSTLSAGQRRRACLLAAMVGAPHLLVLDEPTDGLDAEATAALVALLREHVDGGGIALMATHDRGFVSQIGGRLVRLEGGVLQAEAG